MLLDDSSFSGIAPRINPDRLPVGMSQTAENCDFRGGDLKPLRGTSLLYALNDPAIRSILNYNGVWRAWDQDVSCIRDPVTVNQRMAATGADAGGPITWDASMVGGTQRIDHTNAYYLGVPEPTTAPTITVTGDACPVDSQPSIAFAYIHVNGWQLEGPFSPVSATINACLGNTITISGFSPVPAGYNITHRRIYANFAGAWQEVAEIAVGTDSHAWTFAPDTLGPVPESRRNYPPPPTMYGLKLLSNHVAVALDGYRVLMSEQGKIHAWPYEWPLEAEGVALLPIGDVVAVLTKGMPHRLIGSDPATMDLRRIESTQACASARSAVDMGDYGLYAGVDGLVMITPDGVTTVVTADYLTPEQWNEQFNPPSIIGFNWRGVYVGFYRKIVTTETMAMNSSMNSAFAGSTSTPGAFIFDPKTKGLVTLSLGADWRVTGGAPIAELSLPVGVSYAIGKLALLLDGNIVEFAADNAAYLTATRKSKKHLLDRARNFGAAQVIADAYPVTFNLYGNGTLRATKSVTDAKPFRLPSGYRAEEIEYDVITSAGAVRRVLIAETMRELAAV